MNSFIGLLKKYCQTGYTTTSIFCMPITIRGNIIGVVEFINKNEGQGVFTEVIMIIYLQHLQFPYQEDEETFEEFGAFLGLALNHATLYQKIRKSENVLQVPAFSLKLCSMI